MPLKVHDACWWWGEQNRIFPFERTYSDYLQLCLWLEVSGLRLQEQWPISDVHLYKQVDI